VSSRHREPWFGVECDGCRVALAGGQMSNLSGKPTFKAPFYGALGTYKLTN
jgi:hypothetical protein